MIKELVNQYGIDAIRVTIPSRPIFTFMGISYEHSNDYAVDHEHNLVERRYKINNNYKVEFEPIRSDNQTFAPTAIYISKLEMLIKERRAKIRVLIPETIA